MKVLEYKGKKFINLTPHELVFESGEKLEPYDDDMIKKVKAIPKEVNVSSDGLFVRTEFEQTEEGKRILLELVKEGYTVISSLINAQAYKGLCVSPIATPETVRAPPNERRVMYKFNVY